MFFYDSFSSCKMVGEEAEKLDTREKKHQAKKAHASGKVKKSNLKAKMLTKGKPHLQPKPNPMQISWQIFPICYIFQKGHV